MALRAGLSCTAHVRRCAVKGNEERCAIPSPQPPLHSCRYHANEVGYAGTGRWPGTKASRHSGIKRSSKSRHRIFFSKTSSRHYAVVGSSTRPNGLPEWSAAPLPTTTTATSPRTRQELPCCLCLRACTPPAARLSRPRLAALHYIISTYCAPYTGDVFTESQPVLPVFPLGPLSPVPAVVAKHVCLLFYAFSYGARRSSQAAIPLHPPLPTQSRRETSL